ncbi:hypothetical protein EV356DRAFT_23118 [Viridothelium virens]|uniref:DUF6590 domain-containing protein n=1 Tax=Viridothelium virens TaxID=1048519 RepID=A0A6A6GTY9_VIRVR|nr:hypothetical protein EV356DRAFT_23118 [Viridothelium virens]
MALPQYFPRSSKSNAADQRPNSGLPAKRNPRVIITASKISKIPETGVTAPSRGLIPVARTTSKLSVAPQHLNEKHHTRQQGYELPDRVFHLPQSCTGNSTVYDCYKRQDGWICGINEVKRGIQEGAIILAMHVGPLLDTSIAPGHGNRAENVGGALFAKKRFFIILSKHERHFTAIPIFTHDGKGIQQFHPELRQEYVGISRLGPERASNAPHLPLLLEAGTRWQIKPEAHAHFTKPYCIDYSCPILPKGYITMESLLRLWALYRKGGRANTQGSLDETMSSLALTNL